MNAFFVASEDEIRKVLRGWVIPPPLPAEPFTIEVESPFARGMMVQAKVYLDPSTLPKGKPDAVVDPSLAGFRSRVSTTIAFDDLPRFFGEISGRSEDDASLLIIASELVCPREPRVGVYRVAPLFTAVLAGPERFDDVVRALSPGGDEDIVDELRELQGLAQKAGTAGELYFWYDVYDS